ncbi:MAG: hypothetical protein HOP96_11620 [Sphingomonas sp.]|nr:hypothetical protein [Sphingomonas sp.]
MKRLLTWIVALAAASAPAPVAAQGASGFSVVNATGLNMTGLTIRRYGTQGWKDLGTAPSPGGRGAIKFADPDCAFDIQATLQGVGTVVWTGVNLCQVKAVILSRNASGAIWVDYE